MAKKRQETLESLPGLYPSKKGKLRFRPMTGLVGCVFYLILICTCFWPKTDEIYLFLAAALLRFISGYSYVTTAIIVSRTTTAAV